MSNTQPVEEKSSSSPVNVSTDHEAQDGARADQDIAIAMVGEHRQDIDPAVEARVVRKIDWFLIPTMIFGYGLVYYDKVNPPISGRLCIFSNGSTNRQSWDPQSFLV